MIRQRVYDLPKVEKEQYDSITYTFDDAWLNCPHDPPAIEDYLPGHEPLRGLVLVALIKTDLECRRKRFDRVTVTHYLERFSELRDDPDAQVELILWEWALQPERTRNAMGFLARFPQLASRLESQLKPLTVADSPIAPAGFSKLEELGRGSMGVVFSAWEEAPKRPVALKFLYPSLLSDATATQRLRIEAEVLANLSHPNVVGIHWVDECDGQFYLVFELCPGGSLEERLRSGPLEADAAAQLVRDIARGVHAANEAGVIHRDLKPANVLYSADGTPKVADFGLARRLDDARLTRSGELIGTISYAAPEQLSQGVAEITRSADVYALGSILYHALTGRPPFFAATHVQTYLQVLGSEPIRPSRLARIPRDLETICLCCLAKNPSDRYANAQELVDDLGRYLRREPIQAQAPHAFTRFLLWCRRNPSLAAASSFSVAALLAIAILSVVFGWHQRRAADELRVAVLDSRFKEALSRWDFGRQLCEQGEVAHGLLVIAQTLESLDSAPEQANLQHALRTELAGWMRHVPTIEKVLPHPDRVLALAASADGKTAVAGCADGKVYLWDLDSGDCRLTLNQHRGEVIAVTCGPDELLLTAGQHGQILLWNVNRGDFIGSLDGHRGAVLAVAISSEGDLALTGAVDKEVRLWDLATRKCLAVLPHHGAVTTVGFQRGGRQFFTGGEDQDKGELRLYERDGKQEWVPVWRKSFQKRVRSAALSPTDPQTLLIGDDDWDASFFDMATRCRIAMTDLSRGRIRSVAFSPDGHTALIGAHDSHTAFLWEMDALRTQWKKEQPEGGVVLTSDGMHDYQTPALLHPQPVTAVTFVAKEPDRVLTACEDGFVRVWQLAPGHDIRVLPHSPKRAGHKPYEVRSAALDSSARQAATAGDDGRVVLWNVASEREVLCIMTGSSPVVSVLFTRDGKQVVTGSKDGNVRFWDRITGRETSSPISSADISGLCLSPDDDLLFIGGAGVGLLWDLRATEKAPRIFAHGSADVSIATAMAPRQGRFLTMGEDGRAKLWDADGELVRELKHENQAIRGGSFSPDGQWVITAGDDGNARVWNAQSGTILLTLTHPSEVFSASLLPGRRAITAGRTGAQLWDLSLQRRIGPSCRYESDMMQVACSVDGNKAVLADWNGYGVVWHLPQALELAPARVTAWMQWKLGIKLDPGGGRQTVSGSEWQRLQSTLSERGMAERTPPLTGSGPTRPAPWPQDATAEMIHRPQGERSEHIRSQIRQAMAGAS